MHVLVNYKCHQCHWYAGQWLLPTAALEIQWHCYSCIPHHSHPGSHREEKYGSWIHGLAIYVQQQDTPEARYPMVSDSPPITTRPYYNQQGTSQDHDGISFTILDDSRSNSVQQFDAVQDKITHLPGSPSTTLKHSFPPALVQSGWNIYHLQTGLQLPA